MQGVLYQQYRKQMLHFYNLQKTFFFLKNKLHSLFFAIEDPKMQNKTSTSDKKKIYSQKNIHSMTF